MEKSPAPPRLLLATGNAHKVREMTAILRELLPGLDFQIAGAGEFPGVREPEENGVSFLENALIKAHHYARATGLPALADDSGLVVDALDGRPGLRSARYAPTAEARIARVLEEMADVPEERRAARFVCVAAVADPNGNAAAREGTIEGRIAFCAKGEGGFGYDPIFIPLERDASGAPNAEGRSLAEYAEEEKNRLSHRGRALAAAAEIIERLIRTGSAAGL